MPLCISRKKGQSIYIGKGRDENHCWIDWIIYSGEERDFDLTGIGPAVFSWSTYITTTSGDLPPGPPGAAERSGKSLTASMEDLRLSIAAMPAKERELQQAKLHPLDQ